MHAGTATSQRDVADSIPDDPLDELQCELGQVEWLGHWLRDPQEPTPSPASLEAEVWSRLLAWTF